MFVGVQNEVDTNLLAGTSHSSFQSILITNVMIDCLDHLIFMLMMLLLQQLPVHALTC